MWILWPFEYICSNLYRVGPRGLPMAQVLELKNFKTVINWAVLKIDQQKYTFLESPHRDGSSGTT